MEQRLALLEQSIAAHADDTRQLRTALLDLIQLRRRQATQRKREEEQSSPIAVLVITCDRPEATQAHLAKLIRLRPSPQRFPIVVSQDCGHQPTAAVIQAAVANHSHISHVKVASVLAPLFLPFNLSSYSNRILVSPSSRKSIRSTPTTTKSVATIALHSATSSILSITRLPSSLKVLLSLPSSTAGAEMMEEGAAAQPDGTLRDRDFQISRKSSPNLMQLLAFRGPRFGAGLFRVLRGNSGSAAPGQESLVRLGLERQRKGGSHRPHQTRSPLSIRFLPWY